MENAEIAGVFNEIADLLEIKGENPFRVRSYRNAALVVEGWPESFRTLLDKGPESLEGIHGIGASIREKIIEMLTTGSCKFHDDIVKEFPDGILDILKLSGVGPKKAALFYNKLGIGTVDGLEKAVKAGGLQGLPGMGKKSEQKILKAIEDFRSLSGKFTLSIAIPYATALMDYIKKTEGVTRVEPAGSLRRWKESVGDLDILALSSNPARVMEAFVGYPEVRDIVSKGSTKSTVILRAGLQVDLRVIEEASFGAALQYFTGSKSHNIALRDRAKKQGLKISEYGVFDVKSGGEKRIAGRTEEEVYEAVGLPWIPPELRENTGEIEAAEEGSLPVPIEAGDIRGDLHAHTLESDGANSLEEMAEEAMKRGYEYLAITDHSKAVGIAHGLDKERALRQIKAIEAYNKKLEKAGKKFRLLKGSEVDIRADGTLDHAAEVLDRLDCVVASIHSGFTMERERMTERIIKAIRSGKINILAHPTGRLIGAREPFEVDMDRVMDEAKKYGMALELNCFPDRLDLKDSHLRLAREKGIPIAVSTDAHSIRHFNNIEFGIHTAMRGWLEKKDILNTRSLKDLMRFLEKKA